MSKFPEKSESWCFILTMILHLRILGLCESAAVWDRAGPHQGWVREVEARLREHQGAHKCHGGQAKARCWRPNRKGNLDGNITHISWLFQVKRLTKETAELRTELAGLKAGLSTGKGEAGVEKWGEAGQVVFLISCKKTFCECHGIIRR